MVPAEQYRDLGAKHRRGRRRKLLTPLMQGAIRVLRERHPDWTLRQLREVIPGLPRNSTVGYLKRLGRIEAWQQRRLWDRVTWRVPGAVWAIDGTWLDRPTQPLGRRALVVIDLHSKKTLCLRSVAGERAEEVEKLLKELFARHGVPLVLKLDNGPGFIARRLQAFCRGRGVTLLYSPVRRPRWNGSCEVSVRWAKHRVEAAWHRRGAVGDYVTADLEAAANFVGPMPAVDQALRERFLDTKAEQLAIAAAERGLVIGRVSQDHLRRSLGRVAVRRALELCHILSIEGRRYLQWLRPSVA
jgi:transposase InsO family protein